MQSTLVLVKLSEAMMLQEKMVLIHLSLRLSQIFALLDSYNNKHTSHRSPEHRKYIFMPQIS